MQSWRYRLELDQIDPLFRSHRIDSFLGIDSFDSFTIPLATTNTTESNDMISFDTPSLQYDNVAKQTFCTINVQYIKVSTFSMHNMTCHIFLTFHSKICLQKSFSLGSLLIRYEKQQNMANINAKCLACYWGFTVLQYTFSTTEIACQVFLKW